jgi:hypothetical protein
VEQHDAAVVEPGEQNATHQRAHAREFVAIEQWDLAATPAQRDEEVAVDGAPLGRASRA